jgi:hypothetical protein
MFNGLSTRRSKLLWVSLATSPSKIDDAQRLSPSFLFSGPLARSFPLLSLRTSKADVVVGIPRSVAEALDERDEKWRTNGRYVQRACYRFEGCWTPRRYALVSFVPRGGSN